MSDDGEKLIERIADSLRPLPAVRDEARAKVLVAVAAAREREREHAATMRRVRRQSGWVISGVAAAAAVFWIVRLGTGAPPSVPVVVAQGQAPPPATATATLAAREVGGDLAPTAVQLMLDAPAAHRVRLVGDFTGWDARGVEMRRDSASGLWSATASVRPGRHVYAFVVDDSTWVRDPRAPMAPDADFGKPGSLLIVGHP